MVTFWATLGNIRTIFIPTSGHTGEDGHEYESRPLAKVQCFHESKMPRKCENEAIISLPLFRGWPFSGLWPSCGHFLGIFVWQPTSAAEHSAFKRSYWPTLDLYFSNLFSGTRHYFCNEMACHQFCATRFDTNLSVWSHWWKRFSRNGREMTKFFCCHCPPSRGIVNRSRG